MTRRTIVDSLLRAALLVLLSFGVAAGDSTGSLSGRGDVATEAGTKPAVRIPGAATGKHGGVAPPAAGVPPGTRVSRSPATRQATRPGAAGSAASPRVPLDAVQGAVLERVNQHRTLAGLAPVVPEARLLHAAQTHADYLSRTGQAGHYETDGADPDYTGRTPFQRIAAAGYDYAVAGEVVGRLQSTDPAAAVDALVMAIYHRLIILSSDFTDAGLGVASRRVHGSDVLDVTVDFGSRTLPPVRRAAALTLYPVDGQQGVPLDFNPTHESPNPLPGHSLVGYPISLQADDGRTLTVDSLALHVVRSGSLGPALAARLLTHSADAETPPYAAALIPVSPLSPSTTYRVVFSGAVAGAPVSRSWQFTTAAPAVVRLRFASPTVPPGGTQKVTIDGLDTQKGDYYVCHAPAHLVSAVTFESDAEFALTTSLDCASGKPCEVTVATSYQSSCASPFAEGTFTITR